MAIINSVTMLSIIPSGAALIREREHCTLAMLTAYFVAAGHQLRFPSSITVTRDLI